MNNLNLSNIDELPESGWGLKILFPLADELTYNRTPDNNQNCLKLVKNYNSTDVESSSQNQKDPGNKLKKRWSSLSQHSTNSPKIIKQIQLQVNSDLAVLEDVLAWYQQLEDQPIPKPIWWQCQIALAEGFTNAVNHAHKNLPCTTPIHLQVTVFHESLEICIWDYGPPFDLKAQFNNSPQN